jgi:hypothetical protein
VVFILSHRYFASVSGLIGVVLAIKGYKLFAKKESIKGIIISSVIAFLVLVLAWYLCFGKVLGICVLEKIYMKRTKCGMMREKFTLRCLFLKV